MFEDPKKQIKFYISIYVLFLFCAFVFTFFIGCSNHNLINSSVAPDSTYKNVFNVVVCQDSSEHWYVKIYEGNNWCYYHHRYEEVKRVRR